MFESKYNFLKHSKLYYIISAAIIVITILTTIFIGPKVDIEFKGGSIATYSYEGAVEISKVESIVKKATGFSASVRLSENSLTGKQNIVISIAEEINNEAQIKMTDSLEKELKDNKINLVESSSVNPMNGKNFFIKCLIAVAFASILLILYIAFRFRNIGGWSAGVTAIIALVHDLIVTYAVYAIFQIEIGGNFMAVMLTILGYSINNTIIVFDRVRENTDIYGKKLPVAQNVNMSLNQSMQRAINTTVTTLIALAIVVIVTFAFNITSMFDFIFPMAVGLVSGVYTSMFLAPSIWVFWKEKKGARRK